MLVEVRCADCHQVLEAAPYSPDAAGLVRLCSDCALKYLG